MAKNLVDEVALLETRAEELVEKARGEAKLLERESEQKIAALEQQYKEQFESISKNLEQESSQKLASALERENQAFEKRKHALEEKAQRLATQLADRLADEFFRINDGG